MLEPLAQPSPRCRALRAQQGKSPGACRQLGEPSGPRLSRRHTGVHPKVQSRGAERAHGAELSARATSAAARVPARTRAAWLQHGQALWLGWGFWGAFGSILGCYGIKTMQTPLQNAVELHCVVTIIIISQGRQTGWTRFQTDATLRGASLMQMPRQGCSPVGQR